MSSLSLFGITQNNHNIDTFIKYKKIRIDIKMLYVFILLIAILIAITFSYREYDGFRDREGKDNTSIPKRGGYTLFFDNSMANIIGLESCKGVVPIKINESKKGYDNKNLEEFARYLSSLPEGARNYGISEFLLNHCYISYDILSQIPASLIEDVILSLDKGDIKNMFFDWDRTLTPFEDIMADQNLKNECLGSNLEYMNHVWIPNYVRYKTMYDQDAAELMGTYQYDGTNGGKGYTYRDMAIFYFGHIFEPLSRLWKAAEKNNVEVYIFTANNKGGRDRNGRKTFFRLLRETGLNLKDDHLYSLADYGYTKSKQDLFRDMFQLC